MKNTKTTIAGIGAILVAIGGALKAIFDGDPTTSVDPTATVAAISAGIGLVMAKDASEKLEIKKSE
jgi:ABC-type branched-subunit amino acid transport system permease subunit